MFAFVVLGLCFSMQNQEIGLGNISKMTYFVSSGMQNYNLITIDALMQLLVCAVKQVSIHGLLMTVFDCV